MARTPSQRGKFAKNRGSSFELEIKNFLFDELGIEFKRNLEQTRTSGLSDLITNETKFPFALELKRRQSGSMIPTGAWAQSIKASDINAGIYPAVIYRYDHRKARCVVPFSAIAEMETGLWTKTIHDKADISLPRFCKLVREIMAWRAQKNDL